MQYISTRGAPPVSAAEAIVQGICPYGGLYVPTAFPALAPDALLEYAGDYPALAQKVMQPYLDIPEAELLAITKRAYASFDTPAVTPIVTRSGEESVLELFHGPTLAFKDMALQMLPHLMLDSMRRTGETKNIYILVATSGDTGKAALSGFQDVDGTAVQVFYPYGGVSRAQWLQMVTQEGRNVFVCGVEGNFDDAQTAVKRIFADESARKAAAAAGYRFSSANSINFGRLLPQIAYYYAAYVRLLKSGAIQSGEKINFCVPTGNFGNILAGYYAMRMGLPVEKLICASNRNNVLTDFFHEGKYDARRPFHKSMSCSIDILVSSNLERLLFETASRDAARVREWMNALGASGHYEIGGDMQAHLRRHFYADWCDEEATLSTIRRHFDMDGYLLDPHTAVAQTIFDRYPERDKAHTVLLSTANPFKFASDVLRAFETPDEDDFKNARRLAAITGKAIPRGIAELEDRPILHDAVCSIADMPRRAIEVLTK